MFFILTFLTFSFTTIFSCDDDPIGWLQEAQCGIGGFRSSASKMVTIDDYLYLGFGYSTECFETTCDHEYFDADFLRYDTDDAKWELINTQPDPNHGRPTGRAFLGMTATDFYDDCDDCPEEEIIVLYGGADFSPTLDRLIVFDDFWYYSTKNNRWHRIQPVGNTFPGPLIGVQILAVGDYIYLFGGISNTFQAKNDLYRYSWLTNQWELINPVGNVKPGERYTFPMLYNEDENSIYITCGNALVGGDQWGDLWRYKIDNNQWIKINPINGDLQPRTHNGAAIDEDGNVIVFFGDVNDDENECQTGLPSAGHSPTSETWVYVKDTNTWVLQDYNVVSPTIKRVAFTQTNDKVYAMGGFNFVCGSDKENGAPVWNEQLLSLDFDELQLS